MDFSFQTTYIVRRILMSSKNLINDLKTEISNNSLATALMIDKNGNEKLIHRFVLNLFVYKMM